MDLAILLDAPQIADGATTSLHPIAKLGRYKDPRYGKFTITRADVASWEKNLRGVQGGRVPIDYDHQAEEQGGSTKAAGWITGLRLMTGAQLATAAAEYADSVDVLGEYEVATIQWTPEGAQAVRDGYWLFVSPTFVSSYRDEQQVDHGPALIGTALTNRPFLRSGMPAVSLTRAPLGTLPEAVADDDQDPRDSRAMPEFLKKLALALKLPDDATEDQILEAVGKSPEPVKLDDAAKAEGKVVLTKAEHDKLQADAKATEGKVVLTSEEHDALKADAKLGADAHKQLAEITFTTVYDKALSDGRLPSDKDTREKWKARYDSTDGWGPTTTLEALGELPKIANTTAAGGAASSDGDDAPDGVDPDRHALHQRALSLQTEKKITYLEAAHLAEKELAHAS